MSRQDEINELINVVEASDFLVNSNVLVKPLVPFETNEIIKLQIFEFLKSKEFRKSKDFHPLNRIITRCSDSLIEKRELAILGSTLHFITSVDQETAYLFKKLLARANSLSSYAGMFLNFK